VSSAELDKHLVPGQWYYFYNHPKYLLKHPGGAWQGENSLYMGRNPAGQRLWAGLGASNKTEDEMIAEMVSAYGGSRDAEDERSMKDQGIKNPDGTYNDPKYDPKHGEFKAKVTRDEILHDHEYEIGGTTRHGGFLAGAGTELDAAKVAKLRAP
jgi:Protein-glutamine gamma-glutamyltransferase